MQAAVTILHRSVGPSVSATKGSSRSDLFFLDGIVQLSQEAADSLQMCTTYSERLSGRLGDKRGINRFYQCESRCEEDHGAHSREVWSFATA